MKRKYYLLCIYYYYFLRNFHLPKCPYLFVQFTAFINSGVEMEPICYFVLIHLWRSPTITRFYLGDNAVDACGETLHEQSSKI